MSSPKPEQFAQFYHAVNGYDPFPWQARLATRVCDPARGWPRAIALPTAAGKTACIDIAVFALACRAKDAPRRIFFVVDRRIIVDQAWMHATKLAEVLRDAESDILKDVADSLRELTRDENARPLDVYALRGGMYRESAWARSPLQPTVIASTVDQAGSRLLFRGYGVSDSMKPVHAGLVGNDALILLDEAHCAKPFDQTVQAIKNYRSWGEPNPAPFHFVSLTATPTSEVPEDQIARDEEEDRTHPVLGKRIQASKPATLVVAERAKGKKWREELVKKLKEEAEKLAAEFACVGIIVNRVATARELAAKFGDDAVLLTGRMRPLDRDRIFAEKLRPLLSNATGLPPKFVVGTQCLEVGADFDFHALVSECASLDALRQRFGRLNRVAARSGAKAAIVIRADQTEPEDKAENADPVYGNALAKTWQWLKSKATEDVFDFGIAAVREGTSGVDLSELNAVSPDAPVLFPAHLDCWVQTHPIPTPDPDPALFLHGPKESRQPDVQVVFRADLGDDPTKWVEVVALCPPSSSEAVAVPIGVFKKWMADELPADETADVEGGMPEEPEGREDEPVTRPVLRWLGPEKSEAITDPRKVKPDAVYVVSCSAPGIDGLGDFISTPPADYAEEAYQRSRDKALLRLPALVIPEDADTAEQAESVARALATFVNSPPTDAPEWWTRALAYFTDAKNLKRREIERHPLGGVVLTGTRRLYRFDPTYLDDSEPSGSFRGRAVLLKDHSRGVAVYAKRFAQGCGLDANLYEQVGLWHDLGKLDPRFQAMLKQSSPRTAVGEPLAKSARVPTRAEAELARTVHGYPKGARHELLSAALVREKTDDALVLHLIATHHGSARPFASPVTDACELRTFHAKLFDTQWEPRPARQEIREWNGELPERFWRVVRAYGWWGTAYREAVFRLADHAQSRAEQESDCPPPQDTQVAWALPAKRDRKPLHPLPLTGLDGSNPLAFLAALGTLRLAEELWGQAYLRWERAGRWQPVLELPVVVTGNELVSRLHARIHREPNEAANKRVEERHKEYRERLKEAEAALKAIKERKLRGAERESAISTEVVPLRAKEQVARREWLAALEAAVPAQFLSLGKSIAVSGEEFATFASRIAERLHHDGTHCREDADFATAFGSEACLDRNGRVIPTGFQLITGSGHQFFLDTFGALMECVTSVQLHRCLFGTWSYDDPRLSFRWDPLDDRRYAVSWEDPSNAEVRTEHGANLLAAFALPFFTVIPTTRGARTTGFTMMADEPTFTWPLWGSSRSPNALRSCFALQLLGEKNHQHAQLQCFGVQLAFRVRRFEVGKPPLSKLNLCPSVMV